MFPFSRNSWMHLLFLRVPLPSNIAQYFFVFADRVKIPELLVYGSILTKLQYATEFLTR